MAYDFMAFAWERQYLRELAKRYIEYANLPVMLERVRLWVKHNSLLGSRPMVVMETVTFEDELLTGLKCESGSAKEIEKELMRPIINHELIGDDKVVPDYYAVYWGIRHDTPGMRFETIHADDGRSKTIGYRQLHPIEDLKRDFDWIQPSVFSVDRERTWGWQCFVEEMIGDILPVKIKNASLNWFFTPTARIIALMGMETMLYSMVDYPDEFKALMAFFVEDHLRYARWQENEGLLVLNNENDYTGSGSYGFTRELPGACHGGDESVMLKDLWINMNSQESVGISPAMYGEFIFPYYQSIAKEAGLVYYGCCEPVHAIWNGWLSKLANLRKVSISAWCNEEIMGEALRASRVIYSRKPSPNFIGVGRDLDEDAFEKHIQRTAVAARGCKTEYIFRDIYTLSGNIAKVKKAIDITRKVIEDCQ